MPGATATMWDGLSGQARQSEAVTDVSREMYGTPSEVQPRGSGHASGFATNAMAHPIDLALMHKAAFIVVAAAVLLIIEGTIAFKGHIL